MLHSSLGSFAVTWLAIAFGYCVVSWGVGLLGIQTLARHHASVSEETRPRLGQLYLGMVLTMPLLLPLVLFATFMCVARSLAAEHKVRTLRRISRTVREYEFIPVDAALLDE